MIEMPRPGTTPLASVKGRPSMSCCMAPVATMTRPRRPPPSRAPARPIAIRHRGLNTSHAYWAAIAAATLPTPPTMTTRPSVSHTDSRGPTLSALGILRTSACASWASAAITTTGRTSAITEHHEGCGMKQTRMATSPVLTGIQPLDAEGLRLIHAYWRAANYLSVGQIYLLDNPLLRTPLGLEDLKPRLLGHWGTTPGLNLIYAHASRVIKQRELDAIYIMGPGHGGPAGVANAYLEGTYSERYPDVTMDEAGLRKLFRQFSFPGGIPSHNAPETPGSIHEGGELGYALVHAYGAAFDNPDLTVFCIVGDGEAETGPLAASWHSNKFVNPARDGVVLPIRHLKILEDWMRSYHPEELFDASGKLVNELAQLAPRGDRRLSANPHANGGELLKDLRLPDFREYAVTVTRPGTTLGEATRVLGTYLRDVVKNNPDNFRIMGPDETVSNRLGAVLEATNRAWDAEVVPGDDHLGPDGRVMEVLSEHMCEGWLEGYLLTGRHGLFDCYEAFIHIIDSMFNQHAKWLKVTRTIPWRRPIASLNYLLSSHVWRQDHNGFSHQDPGFIDHVTNKKAEVIRVYLAPDANCLLSVADHCLRSRNYVNVIVAGKQPALNYLGMDDAIAHCTRGLGIWDWASTDEGSDPDVVLACAGDVPTLETLAAADLIRRHLPQLVVRVVNVVDLMRLQPPTEHPHGLRDAEFDEVFTKDRPVIFAYHGYPWLIHRLTYRRTNHPNIHVRGYKEEGTTTTPFDMVMLNDLDRYHLVMDVIDRVPSLGSKAAHVRQAMVDQRLRARQYTRDHGEDAPEIVNWVWPH